MAIKQNLPFTYTGETTEYNRLYLIGTGMTTSGAKSYTSPSSGVTYTTANGGEYAIFQQLQTLLSTYYVTATDLNSVINLKRKLRMGGRV